MILGYIRVLARLFFPMFVFGCAGALNAAELKGYATPCPEKQQICFWLKAVVNPPRGWIEDESWSFRYESLFLFENGDHGRDKPLMYLNVRRGDKGEPLEKYIEDGQKGWKEQHKRRTIEKLADFERKNKPGFKVFLYKNPANPEQAFELTAFTQDADAAHPERSYFFEAVLVCPNKEELERTKAAFYELLANL
jgi:hypothetical protein